MPNKKNKNNTNRRVGFSYEHRFVEKLKKQGHKNIKRNYGSLGTTDVSWTDKSTRIKCEAQLKYSNKRYPKLTKKYRETLVAYAKKKPKVQIWFISKVSRKPEIWEQM